MYVTLLLWVSYVLELFVWMRTFDKLLARKYSNRIFYVLFGAGDLLITVLKQSDVINPSIVTVLMFVYIIAAGIVLYKESTMIKILVVSGLFLLSCIADIITAGGAMLIGFTMKELSYGIHNAFASIVSKVLLYLIIRLVFAKKFNKKKRSYYEYKELIVFMCSTVICEAPSAAIFRNMSIIGNNGMLLLSFMFGQITIFSISLYISIIFARRKIMEIDLQNRMKQIEVELQSGKDSAEILEFRHEIKNHLVVVGQLLEMDEIDQAKQYLRKINKIPESSGDLLILKNKSLEIILNQKRMAALRSHITVNLNVTSEIRMDDIELCSLVGNLLDNAIEGTGVGGYINFSIKPDEDSDGVFINCSNTYQRNRLKFLKGDYVTTKEDSENHGLGIKIIRRIVKKNHGVAKFHPDNELFNVEIYLPGGER